MNEDEVRWERVVAKLTEDTRAGTLQWEALGPTTKLSGWFREEVVGLQYRTQVSKRLVHLYEYRYQHYTDEDEWSWINTVGVELVDGNGILLWRFPNVAGKYDLLEAVRRSTSGANDLLDHYLDGLPDDDAEIPF